MFSARLRPFSKEFEKGLTSGSHPFCGLVAEESRRAEFFGQLIVGGQKRLKVGGTGHCPELIAGFGQVVFFFARALAVVHEEVATREDQEGVGGGYLEFGNNPAGLIVAQPEDDLDTGSHVLVRERNFRAEA